MGTLFEHTITIHTYYVVPLLVRYMLYYYVT